MADEPKPRKIPLVFYRTRSGNEPVRQWLKGFIKKTRVTPDSDLATARKRRKELER